MNKRRARARREREFTHEWLNRVAGDSPEPRSQLHHGGLAMTDWLVREVSVGANDAVLDICCGEGGTAVRIAREVGANVTGIDIIPSAIAAATERARRQEVGRMCRFDIGDIFDLPYADAVFNVVIGQDPDGLAEMERVDAFRECHRVLARGGRIGIHHWILASGAPPQLQIDFDQASRDAGFPSHDELNAEAYTTAMTEAGFTEVRELDKSRVYRRHLESIVHLTEDRGDAADPWTVAALQAGEHHPLGVALIGRKR